jgi:serine/threonine protein kinase
LVKFYGSFRQLGSYCLILEFADGGDLGEFFDKCSPPSTVEDVALFWRSLFQVFAGLERIHKLMSYNDDELIRG